METSFYPDKKNEEEIKNYQTALIKKSTKSVSRFLKNN